MLNNMKEEKKGVSKSQYVGLIVLAVLSMMAMIVTYAVEKRRALSTFPIAIALDSMMAVETIPTEVVPVVVVPQRALVPFDPNTADSLTLINEGIPSRIVRSMLRYRSKGGRYRYVADLVRVPGMSDSLYFALKPYVRIDTEHLEMERRAAWQKDSLHRDSLYRIEIQRERGSQVPDTTPKISNKRDTVLELNSADTTSLQYIRGIGAYRAKMIVRYRTRLGGYADVYQLRDAEMEMKGPELADSIIQCFYVNTDSIHKLLVNRWGAERMSKHPYLSYTQAKAIYELRRRNVYLRSEEPIIEAGILTQEQVQRLMPYLDFSR